MRQTNSTLRSRATGSIAVVMWTQESRTVAPPESAESCNCNLLDTVPGGTSKADGRHVDVAADSSSMTSASSIRATSSAASLPTSDSELTTLS